MEVHAHSHTARKKWTHYFWEFLMLFLAVFCGFLAEYQLEHKIEREKGKQYIYSFYEDLKSDTAEFSYIIKRYERKFTVFKNRSKCFDSMPGQFQSFKPCIADLFSQASSFPDMVNEDRTMVQLKNAGGLRLLKRADADSILDYDKMIRIYLKSEATGLQECQYRMRELIRSMMNYKNMSLTSEDASVPFLNSMATGSLDKFFVTLDEYANVCNDMKQSVSILKGKAISLINYFQKKYNLE